MRTLTSLVAAVSLALALGCEKKSDTTQATPPKDDPKPTIPKPDPDADPKPKPDPNTNVIDPNPGVPMPRVKPMTIDPKPVPVDPKPKPMVDPKPPIVDTKPKPVDPKPMVDPKPKPMVDPKPLTSLARRANIHRPFPSATPISFDNHFPKTLLSPSESDDTISRTDQSVNYPSFPFASAFMDTTTPRKPGRPRDPDLEARRRTQILDTAATIFAACGFAATDVQVIADRIGVGKGTVYRYFPTKEQLFLAAVERGLRELTAEMDRILDEAIPDPVEHTRRAVRAYLGFFHRRPEMAELFIQERAAFPHHHRPLYFSMKEDNDHECQHAAFWNKLAESGQVRPMPAERFFAVVGDLLYGTILTNLLAGRPADPATQTEDILDIIMNGMLTAKGKR